MNRRKTRFFDRHQLFKVVGIFMLFAAILTWVYELGYFQEGQFMNDEMTRIGISDFLAHGMFGHYNYPTHFMLLFAVAGFYKFVGSLSAYQKLTDNIANRFRSVKTLFAILVMILMAAFTGVAIDYFAAIAIIPFFITILSKMRVDKVVGVASTFGGVLIGILCASYSGKIIGELASTNGIGIKYGYQRDPIIIMFAVSLLLLAYFIWKQCRKNIPKESLLRDPFASNVLEGKSAKQIRRINTRPMALLLFVILGVIAIAYIPWNSQFNVTLFEELHESITTATLFDTPIFSYIIGNVMPAIGQWDIMTASVSLMIAALVIKIVYSVSFDKMLDEFIEGFKIALPTMVIMLMVFALGVFTYAYPVMSNFVNSILQRGKEVIYIFTSGIAASLFTSDLSLVMRLNASAYTTVGNLDNAGLALQSAYGFVSLIAPSSLMLMTGLSMLRVKYTEWIKFIWKFAALVLILIIAILSVL